MDPAAYVEMDAMEERHWWFRGKRRLLAPLIRRMLGTAPKAGQRQRVLEIGCGTGGNLFHFSKLHPDASFVGLDFDAGATSFSKRKSDRSTSAFDVLQGDGLRLPIATGSMNGALALDIIEHFEDDDAVCAELARILAPGASLVLSVPAWPSLWSPHDEFLHHARRYRPEQIRTLVQRAGLEIQETRGFNFLLLPAIWLVRRAKSGRAQGKPAEHESGGTDFFEMPAFIEAAFAGLFILEAALVRVLPIRWGVSILIRAEKPKA
jgi:SAM-dependent methyltransferase